MCRDSAGIAVAMFGGRVFAELKRRRRQGRKARISPEDNGSVVAAILTVLSFALGSS